MDELRLSLLLTFGPVIALFLIGLTVGTILQRRHYRSLEQREAALGSFLLTNVGITSTQPGELVTGSTVVAYDFFRRVAILLRKMIGGRFSMHEAFMERARREAILRMAESAKNRGNTTFAEKQRKVQAKKTWMFISPTGSIVWFKGSLKYFCEQRGLNYGRMAQVHKGAPRCKSHKGWKGYGFT